MSQQATKISQPLRDSRLLAGQKSRIFGSEIKQGNAYFRLEDEEKNILPVIYFFFKAFFSAMLQIFLKKYIISSIYLQFNHFYSYHQPKWYSFSMRS